MFSTGQVDFPRRLVWIEAQSFSGWGCSECIWVFNSSRWPPGKSVAEMKDNLQGQLYEGFASHVCGHLVRYSSVIKT
jgi:hypothetical protein